MLCKNRVYYEKNQQRGFTLLELLISVGLLSIIGIITAQTLKSTTRKTIKITSGIDSTNTLRSAFRLIERDISAAFNYRDLNIFLYNQAQKERVERYAGKKKAYVDKKNSEGANPALNISSLTPEQVEEMEKQIGGQPVNKPLNEEIVVTHFKGEKDSFYFTSSGGSRLREDEKISELMEVGYLIKDCKMRRNEKIRSKCLWRSVSYNLDGDIEEGGSESVLLENVTSFELKYLTFNQEDPEWIESWDSQNFSDVVVGNKFPSAVSVSLEVNIMLDKSGDNTKAEKLYGVFPIRFPNNEPFKELIQAARQNPTGGGNENPSEPPPPDITTPPEGEGT